jgi:hypothetical protein
MGTRNMNSRSWVKREILPSVNMARALFMLTQSKIDLKADLIEYLSRIEYTRR